MASLAATINSKVLLPSVLEAYRKKLVFGQIVNSDLSNQAPVVFGESIRVASIGNVTVEAHTVNDSLTYTPLDASDMVLPIDQQNRFAHFVDTVEATRSNVEIVMAYMDRGAYQLADQSDQYIASLHGDAGITTGLGSTATPLTVTAAATAGSNIGVRELVSRIKRRMDDANVDDIGRRLVVPPWFYEKMGLAKIFEANTQNAQYDVNGLVGRYLGFDVYMSNNIVNAASATGSKVMAFTGDTIAFVNQISDARIFTGETFYGTGLRALNVYGAKVVRTDSLAVATVSEADG